MKNILFLALLALLGICFYGCGDNSVTPTNNNGNTTETVIWEKDSLNIEGVGYLYRHFTDRVSDTTVAKIRFAFTSETDCIASDSAYSEIYFNGDTLVISQIIRTFNMSHSYIINTNNESIIAGLHLYFNSSAFRYLRFKNIKVYKVQ
jgi:hypothetical protein